MNFLLYSMRLSQRRCEGTPGFRRGAGVGAELWGSEGWIDVASHFGGSGGEAVGFGWKANGALLVAACSRSFRLARSCCTFVRRGGDGGTGGSGAGATERTGS